MQANKKVLIVFAKSGFLNVASIKHCHKRGIYLRRAVTKGVHKVSQKVMYSVFISFSKYFQQFCQFSLLLRYPIDCVVSGSGMGVLTKYQS